MKRYALAALAVLLLTPGCAGTVTKHFKVFAEPADADITVVSGLDLKAEEYHSPAHVTAEVPTAPDLASKATVEVSKDEYEPVTVQLGSVREGQTLNVKLEKIVRHLFVYRLTYRLVAPVVSKELAFKDKTASFAFSVADDSFQMRFTNLRDGDVRILWEQSQYTDVNRQPHRLMHSGIRFQNRHNPVPDQVVPAGATVDEAVFPVDSVSLSPETRTYGIRPLFSLYTEDAAALKGRSFTLFFPVQVGQTIIPYNFRIEISAAEKETVKQ